MSDSLTPEQGEQTSSDADEAMFLARGLVQAARENPCWKGWDIGVVARAMVRAVIEGCTESLGERREALREARTYLDAMAEPEGASVVRACDPSARGARRASAIGKLIKHQGGIPAFVRKFDTELSEKSVALWLEKGAAPGFRIDALEPFLPPGMTKADLIADRCQFRPRDNALKAQLHAVTDDSLGEACGVLLQSLLSDDQAGCVTSEEIAPGSVNHFRRRTINELKALIVDRRRETASLELELSNLQRPRRLALLEIRNIMRALELTIEDVCEP